MTDAVSTRRRRLEREAAMVLRPDTECDPRIVLRPVSADLAHWQAVITPDEYVFRVSIAT